MVTEYLNFTGAGGKELPAAIYSPEGGAKKALIFIHGMTEHCRRYEGLARYLSERGAATAAFDLRGHGENACLTGAPSFGEGGWDLSLDDMERFYRLVEERFHGAEIYMLGFSLGSFLLRDYLNSSRPRPKGAVIMGSGQQPGFVMKVMKAVVKGQIQKAGFDYATPLVESLSFENYNRPFKPARTRADWLCSDEGELDKFLSDPLVRPCISSGLFWQMLDSMDRTGSKRAYDHWDKALPVLLLSGAEDPVGDKGKGIALIEATMKRAGLTKVQTLLVPGARHDLLHESASGAAGQAMHAIASFMGL